MRSPVDSKKNLEEITECYINRFIERETEGNDAETWKIAIQATPHPAYLKITSNFQQIVSEIVAAKLGRALNLPVPKTFLTSVPCHRLPRTSSWFEPQESYTIGLVSMSGGKRPISFERMLKKDLHLKELANWKDLEKVISFDEWIINDDRHNGNLIYDPETNSFWIIDHGKALLGFHRKLWPLEDPTIEAKNILLDNWSGKTIKKEQDKLVKTADKMMKAALKLNIESLNNDGFLAKLESKESVDEIINFIEQRIFHTVSLLCKKMDYPQLPFLAAVPEKR